MLNEISIEVIRKCPNRCVHCSSLSTEKCSEMIPLEKFKEVIDGGKCLGLEIVCFSGGEPFLHPNITEMVDYVIAKGLKCYIYSSGICFDVEGRRVSIPDMILDRIKQKVTKIIFNIEAVDDNIYNSVMGTEGCLKLLEDSIKKAVNRKINVEAHFVPMKLNEKQIEPVIEFCEKLHISKVSFLRLVPHGRALTNIDKLLLSEKDLKNVEASLLKLRKDRSSYIRIGVPLIGETQEAHCEAANGKLNIRYDGNVYPCEVFKNHRIGILDDEKPGNIFDEKIEDIYKESAYLKKVRALVEKFSCSNCCENCVGQYYINQSK